MFQARHLSSNVDHLEAADAVAAAVEAVLADETDMAVAAVVLAVTEIEATDAVAAVAVTDQDINLFVLPVRRK